MKKNEEIINILHKFKIITRDLDLYPTEKVNTDKLIVDVYLNDRDFAITYGEVRQIIIELTRYILQIDDYNKKIKERAPLKSKPKYQWIDPYEWVNDDPPIIPNNVFSSTERQSVETINPITNGIAFMNDDIIEEDMREPTTANENEA